MVGGRGPAIIVPDASDYAEAKAALLTGLAAYKPQVVTTVQAADPATRTVVCLGSIETSPSCLPSGRRRERRQPRSSPLHFPLLPVGRWNNESSGAMLGEKK